MMAGQAVVQYLHAYLLAGYVTEKKTVLMEVMNRNAKVRVRYIIRHKWHNCCIYVHYLVLMILPTFIVISHYQLLNLVQISRLWMFRRWSFERFREHKRTFWFRELWTFMYESESNRLLYPGKWWQVSLEMGCNNKQWPRICDNMLER